MAEAPGVDEPVGLERELAEIEAFLDAAANEPRSLLLEGEPGIGKTTLWRAGLEKAHVRDFRVLAARPAEAEAELSFCGLGDLLRGTNDEIGALPAPQRRALRVALLLEGARGHSPDVRAIGVAMLALLDLFARSSSVLVAVDDVQWLDAPSAAVLGFVLRRLASPRVSFLGAARPGGGLEVEASHRIDVGPIETEPLHAIVRNSMTTRPPRSLLRRVQAVSGGNPFYALEIARALDRLPHELEASEPLPIPSDLQSLVRQRLRGVPPETGQALLAAAALARPTTYLVEAAVDVAAEAWAPALEAGIVLIDRGSIRFTHPLLASAIYADADAATLRGIHGRLAEVVTDTEERALHLAAATQAPDQSVAEALEEAAAAAFERGATENAAHLIERALRFTPREPAETQRARFVTAAEYLARAGARRRARELVAAAYGSCA
jgi:AAA ATPase domain